MAEAGRFAMPPPGLRDNRGDRLQGAVGASAAGGIRPREMARDGCESAYAQCNDTVFVGR
jgi:hypothetical protein